MALAYTIQPLPAIWPGGKRTVYPSRPQFKTIWTRALQLLEREIDMLGGRNVRLQVDATPYDINQNGTLRANARLRSSAVVVVFDTKEGTLQFPCDTYSFWQENVDAIARVLEDLRRAERYGVKKGAQYTGFKQLPAATEPVLDSAQAARRVSNESSCDFESILRDRAFAASAIRRAKARAHPDAGGTTDRFVRITEAERVLAAHHGGSL